MKKRVLLLLIIATTLFSCNDKYSELPDGLYAEIATTKGDIILELEYEKTPVTVANFVTLAEGKNTFVNEKFKGKPFYDGLKFHRVLDNFMIQGGDPLGNGSGDTGYKFKDEITDLKHDGPGVLSMANSGPATNSSQFFITHVETGWLDGKHTVFGHVVGNGMETVNKIVQDDIITSVKIVRKGEAAKKFDAVKVFSDYFATEEENLKKQAVVDAEEKRLYNEKFKAIIDEKVATFAKNKAASTKTASGLQYIITKKGSGKKPANGTNVLIHYAGFFEDGTLFDSSIEEVAKQFGKYDEMRAAQGGYAPLPFQAGRKSGMIPGFIEGIEQLSYGDKATIFIPSNLGYGEAGAGGGIIPPNSNLIFEIELIEK
ncbi:peptidylprolyl isomerase [Flavobacterium sp. PLA-1-15]|uniref:peptidylprolyl isomerase n=1 Tax=Flavobacterium sp. PLA-1-15 TaxID=3380533 RepID=UPI003B78515E